MMRKVLGAAAFAALLAAGVPAANAVAEWWTPKEKDCPTFDSQASCVAYCSQDPARCGGNATCIRGTGAARPQC
jgi:hypothetical protein